MLDRLDRRDNVRFAGADRPFGRIQIHLPKVGGRRQPRISYGIDSGILIQSICQHLPQCAAAASHVDDAPAGYAAGRERVGHHLVDGVVARTETESGARFDGL